MAASPFVGGPLDRFYRWARSFGTARNAKLVLLAYGLVLVASFAAITLLAGAAGGDDRVRLVAWGAPPLEVWWASPAEVHATLDAMGGLGRYVFALAMVPDFLLSALFAFTALVALGFVLETLTKRRSLANRALLLPPAVLALDWLENVLLLVLVNRFPARLDALAATLGAVTLAKVVLGGLLVAIAVAGLVAVALPKRKEEPAPALVRRD